MAKAVAKKKMTPGQRAKARLKEETKTGGITRPMQERERRRMKMMEEMDKMSKRRKKSRTKKA